MLMVQNSIDFGLISLSTHSIYLDIRKIISSVFENENKFQYG